MTASVHAQPVEDDEQAPQAEEVAPVEAAPLPETPPADPENPESPDTSESQRDAPQPDLTTASPEVKAASGAEEAKPIAVKPAEKLSEEGPANPKIEPLPPNVPLDEEGVFLGKDHTGTPDKPALESRPPPKDKAWNENYDGRPDGPVRSEEVLIWIPRTLFFPVHLVLEYLVRQPIIGLFTLAEEYYLFDRVVDLFTFADGDAAIFPSAFYDTGRGFWAAGNFFYNNAWVDGHTIDAFAGYGTSGWFDVTLGDHWTLFENDTGKLSLVGTFAEDPTLTFTGIGPDTNTYDEVFFAERKGEAQASLRVAYQGLNRLGIRTGFRNAELSSGRSPSIDSSTSIFDSATLPGFQESFNLMFGGLMFELDSRDPERDFSPGSGVRLEGFGDFRFSVDDSNLRFFQYGMRPSAFWDISGTNHVLVLSVYAEAISRVGGESVPINERVALGGEDYMRGFVIGRFRGDSALVHSLAYTWPVLFFMDGILFAELGNAFEGFFRNFDYDELVLDWGFGLRTSFSREFGFNLLLAFGSNQIEEWDEGFIVDNVRFSVGATRAY